jgi:hypothetical protein
MNNRDDRYLKMLQAQYGRKRLLVGSRVHDGVVIRIDDCGMGDMMATVQRDDGSTYTRLA